jgi:hypothetical protein
LLNHSWQELFRAGVSFYAWKIAFEITDLVNGGDLSEFVPLNAPAQLTFV